MEHPCPQFLPSTRLLCITWGKIVPTSCYGHHVLHQRSGARTCYGLHNTQIPWLWLRSDDVADAVRHDSTASVGEEKDSAQQRPLLDMHDHRFKPGKYRYSTGLVQSLWLMYNSCVHCMCSYRIRLQRRSNSAIDTRSQPSRVLGQHYVTVPPHYVLRYENTQ